MFWPSGVVFDFMPGSPLFHTDLLLLEIQRVRPIFYSGFNIYINYFIIFMMLFKL